MYIKMDLYADFTERLKYILDTNGVQYSAQSDDIPYNYFNYRKRIIVSKPRTVFISAELTCPKEYQLAFDEFVEKIEKGDDLMPYMSGKIMDATYNDGLLNDWNISHFHLSRRMGKDGFIKRSDYELFAYVTEDAVYLLQIYPHKEEYLYAKQDLFRILAENWPEVIQTFHINDAIKLSYVPNDKEYEQLREAHFMNLTQVGENQIYFPPGGGVMSNGYSAFALRNVDYWHRYFMTCQAHLKKMDKKIKHLIGLVRDEIKEPLELHFLWMDSESETYYVESVNKVIFCWNEIQGRLSIFSAQEFHSHYIDRFCGRSIRF